MQQIPVAPWDKVLSGQLHLRVCLIRYHHSSEPLCCLLRFSASTVNREATIVPKKSVATLRFCAPGLRFWAHAFLAILEGWHHLLFSCQPAAFLCAS